MSNALYRIAYYSSKAIQFMLVFLLLVFLYFWITNTHYPSIIHDTFNCLVLIQLLLDNSIETKRLKLLKEWVITTIDGLTEKQIEEVVDIKKLK